MKVVAGMLLAVAMCGAADKDMQRAIAWERHKERAAARQAQLEKRRPSVTYSNDANRSAPDKTQSDKAKDAGPVKEK
jgi:hypothetical protein